MKRRFIQTLIALGIGLFVFQSPVAGQAIGQDYHTGLGVKIGYWGGGALDVKHFLSPSSAIEGQLSFSRHWFMLTGLYEFHGIISGAPGLKWYVGPGAHLGFYNHHDNESVFLGLDGVLGLDYKFNKAPINLSLDVQPAIDIPDGSFNIWGGLSIRFTF